MPSSTTPFQRAASNPKAKAGAGVVWIPSFVVPDELARLIAQILIISTLATSAYLGYGLASRMLEIVPDAFKAQLWLFVFLLGAWSLAVVLLCVAPAATAACKLATQVTKDTLPYDAYLRTTGVLAIPYLLSAIAGNATGEYRDILLGLSLCSPIIVVVALRMLLNLRWVTTLLSAVFILIAIIVTVIGAGLLTIPVMGVAQRLCGLTPTAINKYFKEHPEELQAFRERERELQNKLREEAAKDSRGTGDSSVLTPPLPERVTTPVVPAPPPSSLLPTPIRPPRPARYTDPPPEVFQPIEGPLMIGSTDAATVQPQPPPGPLSFALGPVRIRPPSGSRFFSLFPHAISANQQSWSVPVPGGGGEHSVAVRLVRISNPRQMRPWVFTTDAFIIEDGDNPQRLTLHATDVGAVVNCGQLNGIGWCRVEARDGQQHIVTYTARIGNTWVYVEATGDASLSDAAAAAVDRFVHYVSLASAGEVSADPYDLQRLLTQLPDSFTSAYLKQLGRDAIPEIERYGAKNGGTPSGKAAEEIAAHLRKRAAEATRTPVTPVAPPPPPARPAGVVKNGTPSPQQVAAKPLTLDAAVASLGQADSQSRREAMTWLATAEPDAARRGEVAVALELALLGADGESQDGADKVAAALAVWWRPQTIDVLLPSIGEKSEPYRRRAVIKVFAATKDPHAVYPIVRWIIREPDIVVSSLKSMGPVAEPEVIKLLTSDNDTVRGHAAEILREIGGKNSLAPLRRASRDKRSGTAAGLARIALDVVQQRVAAQGPGTTLPATRTAPR